MYSSNSGWRTPMMEQKDRERELRLKSEREAAAKAAIKQAEAPESAVGAVFDTINGSFEWASDIPWYDCGSFDVTVDGKNKTYSTARHIFVRLDSIT